MTMIARLSQPWLRRAIPVLLLIYGVAQVAEARRTPTESVQAIVEFERTVIDVEVSGRFSSVQEKQILIQSEEGRDRESVQKFQYIGRENRLKVLEAYTLTADGKKIPVERSAIEDKETAEPSQGFDSVRTVFVSFPRVAPGARLYFRVRHEVNEVPLVGVFGFAAVIEGSSVDQYRVEINSSLPLFFSENDAQDYLEVRSETPVPNRSMVVVSNRRPIRLEIDQEQGAVYPIETQHAVLVSTERDWAKLIKGVHEEFEARLADPIPDGLSHLLRRLQPESPVAAEDVESLLVAIADEFRYFGDWRRRQGGFAPRTLREIAETRYGDCKDLSLLLARVLRSWGVAADIALVHRGDQPLGQWAYALPTAHAFNHAIVRVQLSGQSLWLDPTVPFVDLKMPQFDISDRQALVLGPRQTVEMVRTPRLLPQASVMNIDLRVEPTTEAGTRVNVSLSASGQNAVPLVVTRLTREERDFQFHLARSIFWDRDLVDWQLSPLPRTRLIRELKLSGSVQLHSLLHPTTAGLGFTPPALDLVSRLLFGNEPREGDLQLGVPSRMVRRTSFPQMQVVGRNKLSCRIDTRWFALERRITSDTRAAQIEDTVEIREGFISSADLGRTEFRQAQREVRRCFSGATVVLSANAKKGRDSKPSRAEPVSRPVELARPARVDRPETGRGKPSPVPRVSPSPNPKPGG